MNLVTVIPVTECMLSQVEINEILAAFEVKIAEALAGEVTARRITADKLEELHTLVQGAEGLLEGGGTRDLIE